MSNENAIDILMMTNAVLLLQIYSPKHFIGVFILLLLFVQSITMAMKKNASKPISEFVSLTRHWRSGRPEQMTCLHECMISVLRSWESLQKPRMGGLLFQAPCCPCSANFWSWSKGRQRKCSDLMFHSFADNSNKMYQYIYFTLLTNSLRIYI